MIAKSADCERLIAQPPPGAVAFLVFGPDQGLVRERAERLVQSVVPDLHDPFRVADIDGAVLNEEPARLASEAAALSMTGGRRVVRIRAATNALGLLFEAFLGTRAPEALVVVEAGDLAKDSTLRRVFEDAENALGIPCYLDSAQTISDILRDSLRAEGASLGPDALHEAVSLLGADRGTTRREVEKLVLYASGKKAVTVEDVRAILGDESEARIEQICDAAGQGDPHRLDRALERLWAAGISPTAILRVAIGQFQRLALARLKVTQGESPDVIARRSRPPVHFTRLPAFKIQLRNWSDERIADVLDLLLETEALCKTTAVPQEAACSRAMFTIAAWARLPR
ncbi:MAG: DNA polymerase III subunit delta [Rhizomicrobium sp.]